MAAAAGAKVVDNSAAFRMDPDVPLVVAEVNPDDLQRMPKGIASCPNCTTMVLVTALAPLHRAAGHRAHGRLHLPVGVGRGAVAGMRELDEQWTKGDGRSESLQPRRRHRRRDRAGRSLGSKPIAGNVIPLAGSVEEPGYTSEEWKLVHESRKILHARRRCACTATCVRVPVYVGHAMSRQPARSRAR